VRSDEEVREFLHTEFATALREHQKYRREVYAAIHRWPFVVLGLAGGVAAFVLQQQSEPQATPVLYGALAAPLVYGIFVLLRASQQVRAAGKRNLVGRALRFWNPSLEYDPTCFLSEAVFRKSGLFSESWNDYDGEDWVSGRLGETEFKLSELHVQRTRSGNKSDITIFRGLFVVADFHKSFRGRTYVFPDVAERTLGFFGRAFQKLDGVSGCSLVELEDPEFESLFAVYATDPIEARYVLSTSLMERIKAFRQRTHRNARISFVDECLYLALPLTRNLFERAPSSVEQAEAALRAWVADLDFATRVIEELRLNDRIWSKGGASAPERQAQSA
jgi:hypothetical protein